MTSLVGSQLAGIYLVKKKIGNGSFGEIFIGKPFYCYLYSILGQDTKSRADVAIKFVRIIFYNKSMYT